MPGLYLEKRRAKRGPGLVVYPMLFLFYDCINKRDTKKLVFYITKTPRNYL